MFSDSLKKLNKTKLLVSLENLEYLALKRDIFFDFLVCQSYLFYSTIKVFFILFVLYFQIFYYVRHLLFVLLFQKEAHLLFTTPKLKTIFFCTHTHKIRCRTLLFCKIVTVAKITRPPSKDIYIHIYREIDIYREKERES